MAEQLLYLIIVFPILGVVVNGFLGRRMGERAVGYVACGAILGSLLCAIGAVCNLLSLPADHRVITANLFTWIAAGNFHVGFDLALDPLSSVMILVVTFVGFLIHVYSTGYMHGDENQPRYFVYLNLFMASMLTLVLGANFLILYMGWELVGLCSYLLIGFWFTRPSAAAAGKKAFIVNRVGDFGFALGVMLIFRHFGTLDFSQVFSQAPSMLVPGGALVTAITLLLFLGATGKSAQIPLFVWLPDAMEGPTPVSALIHAATMVTAGVYMVARCHVLFSLAPTSMAVVAIIGALTAIFAASIALVQNDIKRVLAYSTVSQLGYMMLGCGVGAFTAGIFHLATHAFFKALLFLGSGSVIHGMSGEQDIRKMGGLQSKMPITGVTFLIACLAIAGIPPFAGFFSKDEILGAAFEQNKLVWALGTIAALMTAFYMFRLYYKTFCGESRMDAHTAEHVHESPRSMTIPLQILAAGSVLAGFVGLPAFLGPRVNLLHRFLHPVFADLDTVSHVTEHQAAAGTEVGLLVLAMLIAIAGWGLAYSWYQKHPEVPRRLAEQYTGPYNLLLNKWYVDELYMAVFIRPGQRACEWASDVFDRYIIDGAVNLVGWTVALVSEILRQFQSGYARNYAFTMALAMVIVLTYYIGLR